MTGRGGGTFNGLSGGSIYATNGDASLSPAAATAAVAAAAENQAVKYPVINDQMIEMETYANSNGLSVRFYTYAKEMVLLKC